MQAGEVFSSVRDLLADNLAQEAADEVLSGKLNLAQDALWVKMFANPNIGRAKSIVIVVNVPAFTTDLKDYFAPGKPLELLSSIENIRERQTGQDDASFMPVRVVRSLPSVTQTNFNGQVLWDGSTIKTVGASQALDFRVFGTFTPQRVKDKTSPLVPNTGLILSYLTAGIFARSQGNKQLGDDYENKGYLYTNMWMNVMIMEMQDQPLRMQAFGAGLPTMWW